MTDYTANYGWTIPDEYSNPWYAAFLLLLNQVDAQVKSNENAIMTSVSHDKYLGGLGTPSNPLTTAESPAMGVGEKRGFSNGAVTNSTDEFKVENKGYVIRQSYDNSDANSFVAVNHRYVVSSSTGAFVVYDKLSMREITRESRGYSFVEFLHDDIVAVLSLTKIDIVKIPSFEVLATSSLAVSNLGDICVGGSTGKIYVSTGTSAVLRRLANGSADTTTGALPSINHIVCAMRLSHDENTLYILDAPYSGAGVVWFRVYDVSTFGSPSLVGSVQLTSSSVGEQFGAMGFFGDLVALKTTNGGGNTRNELTLINVSTPATPTVVFGPSVGEQNGSGGYFCDGVCWTGRSNNIDSHYLTALCLEHPELSDDTDGNTEYAADCLVDTYGDKIRWNKRAVGETVMNVLPIQQSQFGVVVESVETAEPSSPVIGKYYLIAASSVWNPNAVVFCDARGWSVFNPVNSHTVFELERGIYHDWLDGQWAARVDSVVRGTVTIPSGTTAGTWTSSHIQFNDGNPMMLNDDDLLILKTEQRLLNRYDANRGQWHRENRIKIAPEYQLGYSPDTFDDSNLLGITDTSSYVNFDAETTPDKSGIVYCELILEITADLTSDMEVEYEIRIKGTIFNDAGTYDC